MGTHLPPTERGTAALPTFRPMSIVDKRSPISATAELLLVYFSFFIFYLAHSPLFFMYVKCVGLSWFSVSFLPLYKYFVSHCIMCFSIVIVNISRTRSWFEALKPEGLESESESSDSGYIGLLLDCTLSLVSVSAGVQKILLVHYCTLLYIFS